MDGKPNWELEFGELFSFAVGRGSDVRGVSLATKSICACDSAHRNGCEKQSSQTEW